MKYKTIEELLNQVERPTAKVKLLALYTKYKGQMSTSAGSQHNHQAWEGGYMDHVVDTMNIARLFYTTMADKRRLEFSLSDALVVLFLHDIEKAFPVRIDALVGSGLSRQKAKSKTKYRILHEEDLWELLNEDQKNALDNCEGENESYSNTQRIMRPLAAFCHICDTTSARIWFERPLIERETWGWREGRTLEEEQLWGV
jgi:hypothetical protein